MPRRNQRPEHVEFAPTVIEVVKVPVRDDRAWIEETEFRECKSRGLDRWRQLEEKQRAARIAQNMDWKVCLVYGCDKSVMLKKQSWMNEHQPDPLCQLPLCLDHLTIAWRQMQHMRGTPEAIESVDTLNQKVRERDEWVAAEEKRRHLASREGEIYFLRQNGLVKVGWSRALYARLKSYGPNVELLVHYPGSRDDETCLHRQLRPALAKGREWYEDGQVIAMFVEQALAKHGRPIVEVDWTQPKAVIKQRRHR